jgi:hypothetical protein
MSEDLPISPPKPFFKWAGRYGLAVPLATALPITGLLVFPGHGAGYDFNIFILNCGLLNVISSLVAGVISFFGVAGSSERSLVWVAIAGMFLSCAVGFGIFVLSVCNSIGHGC